MNMEEEIKSMKNAISVMHRELFQADKIPSRFWALEKRVKELEKNDNQHH